MPDLLPLFGLSPTALERRRDEVVSAVSRLDDPDRIIETVDHAVRRYIPADATTWFATDPGSLLPGWPALIDNVEPGHCSTYWHRELTVQDITLYRDLARRSVPVGRMGDESDGLVSRSARYREFMAPQGFADEMRGVLRTGASVWGFVGMWRSRNDPPFSVEEQDFLASLIRPISEALRAALIRTDSQWRAASDTPGLLVFGEDGTLLSYNESGRAWLDEEPIGEAGPDALPISVVTVIAQARAVASGRQRGSARLRIPTGSGRWMVVHASCMAGVNGSPATTAVIIERASNAEVAPIIVAAYDLSSREQEVTRLLAQGLSTGDIAATLFLSPYTVRDHVKAIFAKVGVSSRGELVARLFADHYEVPLHEHAHEVRTG
jgi:DNA-binding CsgD family transcriptional regulator